MKDLLTIDQTSQKSLDLLKLNSKLRSVWSEQKKQDLKKSSMIANIYSIEKELKKTAQRMTSVCLRKNYLRLFHTQITFKSNWLTRHIKSESCKWILIHHRTRCTITKRATKRGNGNLTQNCSVWSNDYMISNLVLRKVLKSSKTSILTWKLSKPICIIANSKLRIWKVISKSQPPTLTDSLSTWKTEKDNKLTLWKRFRA